jgi:hypothetical protein
VPQHSCDGAVRTQLAEPAAAAAEWMMSDEATADENGSAITSPADGAATGTEGAAADGRGAPPLLSAEDVSAEQWADFDEHGYVKLEQLVRPQTLAKLQARIDEIMLGEADVPYHQIMMQLDSTTGRCA